MEDQLQDMITEMKKIQAIAELLESHLDEDVGNIGLLLSGISRPLLEKIKRCELTVRST
jgi:hypothetical protein